MNLKAKPHVQDQKLAAEQELAARRSFLDQKGLNATAIDRDTQVRKLQADIRQTRLRLKSIAAMEKLVADKVQAKEQKLAEKLAAKKAGTVKPKAAAAKKAEAKPSKKDKKAKDKKSAGSKKG